MSFSTFIKDYQGGRLDQILSNELAKVVEATQKFKGAGSLAISINLKPISNSDNETDIVVKFSKKIPQKDFLKSTMFVNQDLELIGDNPNQGKLFDQRTVVVDSETGEVVRTI